MIEIDNSFKYSDSFLQINFQWDLIHQSFTDFINDSLKMACDKDEKVNNELKKLYKTDHEEIVNGYIEDFNREIFTYRSVILESSLLFIYSHFEHTMRSIEDETTRLFPVKKVPKRTFCKTKRKSDSIQSIRQTIIKTAGIDQINRGLNERWILISDFQKIRNKITHNNGSFIYEKKSLDLMQRIKRVVPEFTYIKQSNNTLSVYITAECLQTIVTSMDIYLKKLMEDVWESYKAAKK